MSARRRINTPSGIMWFRSAGPGIWHSLNGQYSICRVSFESGPVSWEVYERLGPGEPAIYGENIGTGLTMDEAIYMAGMEFFNAYTA